MEMGLKLDPGLQNKDITANQDELKKDTTTCQE
jgi:hypothetical protein